MLPQIVSLLLASAVYASPILEVRTVTAVNQKDFDEAHKRDGTATRAFSATEIKTSDGNCLFIDKLSGDFRANGNLIQIAPCDGSTGQLWDIITKGEHNDQAGTMLVVNTLTQACMNFDPRRAAGNQANTFSCGGRADGGGGVTNSQLFSFAGGAGPLSLAPKNAEGTCFTVAGNVIDQAPCNAGDAKQSFTFGGSGSSSPAPGTTAAILTSTEQVVSPASSAVPVSTSAATPIENLASTESPACVSTTIVTVTRFRDITSADQPPQTSADSSVAVVTAAPQGDPVAANPTTPVPVSGAGGTLNPSDAAVANAFDKTAQFALRGVSIKSSAGKCLSIDPTAGDFRQNIIPIAVKECTGSAGEKFDFVTSGRHNDAKTGAVLLVSSLMNGCISLDPRRAVNPAHVFSCGGRADGEGDTSDSQLFPFVVGEKSFAIAPQNEQGKTCLVDVGGQLTPAACSGDASQVFTIV